MDDFLLVINTNLLPILHRFRRPLVDCRAVTLPRRESRHRLLKVDFETEVGLIIVLQHRTRKFGAKAVEISWGATN